MKTHISLKNEQTRILPEHFRHQDVRYTDALVEHFLVQFTKPGDIILDPFMGFGTTLVVAEKLDRTAYGVEYDEARWLYVQSLLEHPERALHGDSTRLDAMDLPAIDFSITSPPYMGHHHKENPFTSYSTDDGNYQAYIKEFANIYGQLARKLKPGARAVIEVSNLKHDDAPITMLAWDIARSVSTVMTFEGEVVTTWDKYGFGYDHSYCLVFIN
jgi:DNA modification methylase